MIYVRDDKPSKILSKHNLSEGIETAFIELNFHKCKWLLYPIYRASSQNRNYFFDDIDKCLGVYSTYEGVALASYFKVLVGKKLFDTFLHQHELTSRNGTTLVTKTEVTLVS